MAGQGLTYDEVLVAFDDIAAGGTQVTVTIRPESGAHLAQFGGRLVRLDPALLDVLRPTYVRGGGDDEIDAFRVGSATIVMCRSLFQRVEVVSQKVLEQTAGVFWRSLTVVIDGVEVSVSVAPNEKEG